MNLTAIYVRLSDEDKNKQSEFDESESIQNQKSMLMDYARQRGWEIYNIYSDEDYAGSDRNRPQFNRLLEDAEKRKFNIVLCKTQSRFTREMELVEKYLHGLFPRWGVRFISIIDNADTEMKGNKKSRQINGLINEWYLEDLSENIKSVLRHKKQQGQHCSRYAIYGYKKDPQDKNKLIIDEYAAEIVKEIFSLYLQGKSCGRIATILNERGISSPGEYKREQGLKYSNNSFGVTMGKWGDKTIYEIIKNQNYTGDLVQARTRKVDYKTDYHIKLPESEWIVVPNVNEPIVSKEDYALVRSILQQRNRSQKSGERSLFVGKLFCPDCKHAMGKNGKVVRCQTAAKYRHVCTWHAIKYDLLIQIVTEKIKAHIEQLGSLDSMEAELIRTDTSAKKISALEKEAQTLEREIRNYGDAISTLYMDKANGTITSEQFTVISDNLSLSVNQKKARHASLLYEIEELKDSNNNGARVKELLDKYQNFDTLDREIVDVFIDKIEVGEKDEQRNQSVNITWLF